MMEEKEINSSGINMNKILFDEIINSSNKIYKICRKTPTDFSASLTKMLNLQTNVYLKHEYQQLSGSFKLRGATNKILKIFEMETEQNIKNKKNNCLLIPENKQESNNDISSIISDSEKELNTATDTDIKNYSQKNKINIVTASTGNHGSAVSLACGKLKLNCKVFVPNNVDKSKADIIELNNAELIKINSNDCLEAEKEAREYVKNNSESSLYISPYNDLDVIAGQGTIGKEILENQNNIDAVFVSVGGGGLISGIANYIKNVTSYRECKIVACQPQNSKVMYASIMAGEILQNKEELETLSDATAGGIEENSITFPFVQKYVDMFLFATEDEIKEALKILIEKEKIIVEGSAALTLACLIKSRDLWVGKNVVLILCGKNISFDKLQAILK